MEARKLLLSYIEAEVVSEDYYIIAVKYLHH